MAVIYCCVYKKVDTLDIWHLVQLNLNDQDSHIRDSCCTVWKTSSCVSSGLKTRDEAESFYTW